MTPVAGHLVQTARRNAENTIWIRTSLDAEISREKPGLYVSYCPALDLYSQGKTIREAKENITEATCLFLESCLQRNTLNEVLQGCGFRSVYHTAGKTRKPRPALKSATNPIRRVNIPAELPMMAYSCG